MHNSGLRGDGEQSGGKATQGHQEAINSMPILIERLDERGS